MKVLKIDEEYLKEIIQNVARVVVTLRNEKRVDSYENKLFEYLRKECATKPKYGIKWKSKKACFFLFEGWAKKIKILKRGVEFYMDKQGQPKFDTEWFRNSLEACSKDFLFFGGILFKKKIVEQVMFFAIDKYHNTHLLRSFKPVYASN